MTELPLTPASEAAPALLTPEGVATMLGVHPATVHRRIKQGQLPAYRVGPTLIRIKMSDVEALLERIPTPTASERIPTPTASHAS